MRLRSGLSLPALFAAVAALAQAPAPAERPGRDPDEERVGRPIPFLEPAEQMRKLDFLLGKWEGTETWSEPRRYKRGSYDGYPGPGGRRTRTVEEGPGRFSLCFSDDGKNPMGEVRSRGWLSWDPARRLYVYDQLVSVFPGILRLSGGFEDGSLVLRGEDHVPGRRRSVRLVWSALSTEGFTETLEAAEGGKRFEPVVVTRFRRPATP